MTARQIGICGAALLAATVTAPALLAQGAPAAAEQPQATQSGPALLVADQVYLTPDRKLVAEGNVEVLHQGTRLSAARVEYDETTERLAISGPIRIDQGDGRIIVLADSAELDRDLRTGLIEGARLVFSQQIQMSSLRLNRLEGRYTQLFKTTVTSCDVCGDGRPPLWQIRARKVVHDDVERQIYFEDAQFRIRDVPVFYLPRLRVPDPTLKRADGFLLPSIRTTTELGTGIRVPYFITLGDHRDLTLEPYLSPQTRTLGYRYRQAFVQGRINFDGAITDDDILPGKIRGYLFGEGAFNLGNDWALTFNLETASDDAYLTNYGISDTDRLQSEVSVTRITRTRAAKATATYYQSLRDTVPDTIDPNVLANGRYAMRLTPDYIGGEALLNFEGNTYQTESNVNPTGRDVARLTADLTWYDHRISDTGLRHDWRAGVAGDMFQVRNDSAFDTVETRFTPTASYRLSMPMTRRDSKGGRQLLEPMVQLGWARVIGDPVPVDESRFVEFDQGDILSLTRFPAPDLREDAATLVYGVNWARSTPDGLGAWATVAQVLRSESDPNFSASSGLSGIASDVLLVGQIKMARRFWLAGRTLLDGDLQFAKTELRGRVGFQRGGLEGTYTFLERDLAENRPGPIHEIYFDGDYQLSDAWSTELGMRYSIEDHEPREAGILFTYATECVELDFSLRRRYTSNTNVEPSTSFGISVQLTGFSGPAQTRQTTTCRR